MKISVKGIFSDLRRGKRETALNLPEAKITPGKPTLSAPGLSQERYVSDNSGGNGCCLPSKDLGYFQEDRSITFLSLSSMEIGGLVAF